MEDFMEKLSMAETPRSQAKTNLVSDDYNDDDTKAVSDTKKASGRVDAGDKEQAYRELMRNNPAAQVGPDWAQVEQKPVNLSKLVEVGDKDFAWGYKAAKYEWVGDYGDVGPEDKDLEELLFNNPNRPVTGDFLQGIFNYEVQQKGAHRVPPMLLFQEAGLHPVLVENIIKCKYNRPTPIQAYCIPIALKGTDLIAIAQTGSGKTAAYLIPVLSRLMGKAKKLAKPRPNPMTYDPVTDAIKAEPLVLIIVPTRELALQIFTEARRLCYRSMLRPCVVHGGAYRLGQLDDLRRGCDILIGTPGRLKDFMVNEPRWVSFLRLKYTIIDEADEMMHSDWQEDLRTLLLGGATNADDDHQYLLFSATFAEETLELARQFVASEHTLVHVGRVGSVHLNIHQVIVWTEPDIKKQALADLLRGLPAARTVIFVNSNRMAEVLDDYLYNEHKFPCNILSGNMTQREREKTLNDLAKGDNPIVIASDVAARGLDLRNIMHVINYDLPSIDHGGIDEYVNRIGRTARIGNRGQATSFFNDRNFDIATDLANILVECNHSLPEFLQAYAPPDHQLGLPGENKETIATTDDAGWGASGEANKVKDDGSTTDYWGDGANDQPRAGKQQNDDGWGNLSGTKKEDNAAWGNPDASW